MSERTTCRTCFLFLASCVDRREWTRSHQAITPQSGEVTTGGHSEEEEGRWTGVAMELIGFHGDHDASVHLQLCECVCVRVKHSFTPSEWQQTFSYLSCFVVVEQLNSLVATFTTVCNRQQQEVSISLLIVQITYKTWSISWFCSRYLVFGVWIT